ncbi:hypothetical protein Bca52824_049642 [Brassica carinata]|uniref:Uncharacterized protein n=1 Tax=Brassica carinata TaxID=52824 RepID=A0A8X7RL69_BRACI|nr:hypothetical protein Bca52824_049642 [Brassica carinata]
MSSSLSFAGDFRSFALAPNDSVSRIYVSRITRSYLSFGKILQNFTGGFTGIGYPSFLLLGFVVVAECLLQFPHRFVILRSDLHGI